MPKRDEDLLVYDMIESCKRIFEYTHGLSYDNFINDQKTADAVIRNFEILGEASKMISKETKENNPEIEWRKIGDFRNVLIHDYFGINYKVIWKIIKDDLTFQMQLPIELHKKIKRDA